MVTSKAVIKALKEIFARFGIPDKVVSDNGPQFSSAEFAVFAKTWSFAHVTSSPTHAQSNGKAESAVKTVKRLFTKCQESGHSEYLALLDWPNTPSQGIGTSLAQRLMGRRCKTLLPIAGTLLMPHHNMEEETRASVGAKEQQRFYYNRNAKPLPLITPGETIRMRLPGEKHWTKGTCAHELGNRSYQVKVGSGKYRRNRRDLLKTDERPLVDSPEVDAPICGDDYSRTAAPAPCDSPQADTNATGPSDTNANGPRKSSRSRKVPVWQRDYVMGL